MAPCILTLLLLACGVAEPPAPDALADGAAVETPAPEAAADGTADFDKVTAALSTKTPEPRCQDVDKLSADAVGGYKHVIATVSEPTFVPMRAATCLLSQHPREAEAEALLWVADPEKSSLTTVALQRLDTLPIDASIKIAKAALAGPHAALAKVKISRLRTPELKALAAE
jgi:hypothetical protein